MGKQRGPLAQFVVRERYRRGFTQEDLASEAGISVTSLVNLETGKRNPSPKTLYRIATALGVDGGTLFDLMEQGQEDE